MLVRAAVTLFWVEAEEVWVVAAAPVRTRTATIARTIIFMETNSPEISCYRKLLKLLIIRADSSGRPEAAV
jgi:hypothetical protein